MDVFGATNNTNWITQLESAKEIKMYPTNRWRTRYSASSSTWKHPPALAYDLLRG
ncbi:MAG: hypothetical protein IPL84_00400 [Chitinophagaceae bacterium]|nr:hypothetical protein [Chitinophagaceae bacterium]